MKKEYIEPRTDIVLLRLSDPYMRLDDVIGGESSPGEGNATGWATGKEVESFFDDVPFGSLWDDDPVEDPFKLDE